MRVNMERALAKRKDAAMLRDRQRAERRRANVRRLMTPLADRPRSAVMQAVAQVIAPRPKSPRLRHAHLLTLARGMPCLLESPICNRDSRTTVACHGAGIALGKGMGYKLSDFITAAGCSACNDYTDAYKDATAEQKALVFWRGHARQLIVWERIAADPARPARDRKAAQWALDRWQEHQSKGTAHV